MVQYPPRFARRAGRIPLALIAWLVLTLAGGMVLVRLDIAERRARFQDEARSVHRLLSQQSAQHDAILASLVALDPGSVASGGPPSGGLGGGSLQRLTALYPQLLSVQRRADPQPWLPGWPGHAPDTGSEGQALVAALADAEVRSRALPAGHRSAVMAGFDPVRGRYALVLAGTPASYALWIDARRLVTTSEWPGRWGATASPFGHRTALPFVDMRLSTTGGLIILHDGTAAASAASAASTAAAASAASTAADAPAPPFGLTQGFRFEEPIDSPAQPFLLSLRRATGPAQWPWWRLASWGLAAALLVVAIGAQRRAREAQRREVEMARLGQVAQLNNLGELAAGIAHELNQPLAAVLSSTQAAQRLLPSDAARGFDDDEALDATRRAMALAAGQARRAADVLGRLRRLVERPGAGQDRERVDPLACARLLVDLLGPELRREAIDAQVVGEALAMRADPVALEQVLYNLLRNAIQALAGPGGPPAPLRRITIRVSGDGARVRLSVRDNGPGLPAEALARLFEPFYTTRDRGLGLGLALCESLARAQDGRLEAIAHPDGAEFVLTLPAFSAQARPPSGVTDVPPGVTS